jgi:hypothetical protein
MLCCKPKSAFISNVSPFRNEKLIYFTNPNIEQKSRIAIIKKDRDYFHFFKDKTLHRAPEVEHDTWPMALTRNK